MNVGVWRGLLDSERQACKSGIGWDFKRLRKLGLWRAAEGCWENGRALVVPWACDELADHSERKNKSTHGPGGVAACMSLTSGPEETLGKITDQLCLVLFWDEFFFSFFSQGRSPVSQPGVKLPSVAGDDLGLLCPLLPFPKGWANRHAPSWIPGPCVQ